MKKRLLIVLIVGLVCLAGCTEEGNDRSGFLLEEDLEGSKLYVHNVTCSKIYEMRTVEDSAFQEKIAETSVAAEQFRPVISTDIILGERPEAYYVFDVGEVKYTFSFFDVKKQLDIGFVHRETPMIAVAKTVVEDTTQNNEEWVWFCSLSAANYAELYEMIQRYTEGDIVT